MIEQGDVWWVDLAEPIGSEAGHRRPMLIVQSNSLIQSRVGTLLSVPLTSNVRWVNAPGNVLLRASDTGLRHDSVAQLLLTAAINRSQLIEHIGRAPRRQLVRVFEQLDVVLGR